MPLSLTGLEYDAARELLARAKNQVKVAVVMHSRGVDCPTAEQILADHEGFLRLIVEG